MVNSNAHRRARWVLGGLSGAVVGISAYFGGSAFKVDGAAVEARGAGSPASSTQTDSPANPDTTQPFWYVSYLNEDAAMPRFDQVINSIRVGPNVVHDGGPPCPTGARLVDESVADGTPLETPIHPEHGQVQHHDTIACGDVVVAHEIEYYDEPDPNLDSQLRSGKARWETSAHGTSLAVFRYLTTSPAWNSGIAADRWHAGAVQGRLAAIARPIHDIGFGVSAIVVWDSATSVQTTLVATNMTIGQLTAIAQELYR